MEAVVVVAEESSRLLLLLPLSMGAALILAEVVVAAAVIVAAELSQLALTMLLHRGAASRGICTQRSLASSSRKGKPISFMTLTPAHTRQTQCHPTGSERM